MEIEKYLKQLGLDQKEACIYLAALEIGESPIMPIVKKVGLPRSTVYHILERLRDEGLVEITETPTRRVYIPLPPRVILKLLKRKQGEIEEQIDRLEEKLPELNDLVGISRFQPKVRFFRGTKEIREIYEEIIESPINEFWYISETATVDVVLGREWLKAWLKRRIAKGIRSKAIWVRSKAVVEEPLYRPSRTNLRSVRYAPEDFKTPTHMMIYGDNVVLITSAQENIGMVIHSRDYATSFRNLFKQLWKVSSEQ